MVVTPWVSSCHASEVVMEDARALSDGSFFDGGSALSTSNTGSKTPYNGSGRRDVTFAVVEYPIP